MNIESIPSENVPCNINDLDIPNVITVYSGGILGSNDG